MHKIFRLNPATALFIALLLPFSLRGAPATASGTTHFVFEGNRIYAEVVFVRPDGTPHKTLAFVDSGSPAMIVSPALYEELQIGRARALTLQIGELAVHVEPAAVSKDEWLPFAVGEKQQVEALLPAGVMQKFQMVIDYAQRSVTLAQPSAVKNEATPVPFRINEKNRADHGRRQHRRTPVFHDHRLRFRIHLVKKVRCKTLAGRASRMGTWSGSRGPEQHAHGGVHVGALELSQVGALARRNLERDFFGHARKARRTAKA
jgi:hypothetical protein